MLEARALEIWDVIDRVEYNWPVGNKALERLSTLLSRRVVREQGETSEALNRRLRVLVGGALKTEQSASDLYEWIVCDWGGVRGKPKGKEVVRSWATPTYGWHADYDDVALMAFAEENGARRISSWSKIFAYAAPDRHAIYDSRVAVALNIALHRIGEGARFHMPESKVYQPKGGPPRPNAVARARKVLGSQNQLGYGDYLVWARAVREQLPAQECEGVDLLAIESRLFSAAPRMADEYLRSLP